MLEAKTDAGHKGTWLCGCCAAAWEQSDVRAHGEGRRLPHRSHSRRVIHKSLVCFGELSKAVETKDSQSFTMISVLCLPTACSGTGSGCHCLGSLARYLNPEQQCSFHLLSFGPMEGTVKFEGGQAIFCKNPLGWA